MTEEVLTPEELAALLKMNRGQVYTLCKTRSRKRMRHPLPVVRINGNLRFMKSQVIDWLKSLEEVR